MIPKQRQVAAVGGGEGCDCSAANVLFCWDMESTTVTSGAPPGCSDGDTTATMNSSGAISSAQFNSGANSLSCPTTLDYASFSATALFNASEGTVEFWVYIDTFVADSFLFRFFLDTNNRLALDLQNTSTARVRWIGGGTTVTATATGSALTTGAWHKVKIRWRAAGDPNLSILINDGNEGTSNTDLPAMTTPTLMDIGNASNNAAVLFLDTIKVWDAWL